MYILLTQSSNSLINKLQKENFEKLFDPLKLS